MPGLRKLGGMQLTMQPASEKLFDDYARFHQIQLANRDVDPVYPVLKEIGKMRGWSPEETVRAVFLHVAYYDLGSCLAALDRRDGAFLRAFTDPVPGLRCGTERRRHRMGDNLVVHLEHLHAIAGEQGGLSRWMTEQCDGYPAGNWLRVTGELLTVKGNGRWAAYKAQPVSEPVLTPSGWKAIGSLEPGDLVIGSDGAPTAVTGVYPQGIRKVFRVIFTDGSWTRCDTEHLWQVEHISHPVRRVMTTAEIDESSRQPSGHTWWKVPLLSSPVQFAEKGELPLDPYLVGVLLGDGHIGSEVVRVATVDQEIVHEVRRLLPLGIILREPRAGSCDYPIVCQDGRLRARFSPNIVLNVMRELGLAGKRSWEKFVPDSYKHASPRERTALLQGLLDTDGSAGKGSPFFSSTSRQLRDDVVELVQSLGGIARKTSYPGPHRRYYVARIQLPTHVLPFRLTRKLEVYRPARQFRTRTIARIVPDGTENTVCIKVSATDQLYVTRNYVVTHNTCEMLKEVCDLPLAAPDMGHANSSGPRHGLALLYREAGVRGNSRETIELLDNISGALVKELTTACEGGDVTLETAETTLCDFHSMVEGRYYPGLDIDVMQEQLNRAPLSEDMRYCTLLARQAELPEAYLGEEGGWTGPDRARKRVYRSTGEIPVRD